MNDPLTGSPFAGDVIPTSRITGVGQNIANYFPAGTTAPTSFGGNDVTVASTIKARAVQYTGKIDEDFTSWWRATLSYARYYSLEPGDTWFNTASTQSGWRLLRRVDATAINSFFAINPTTDMALRYGFNRFPNFDYNSSQGFNVGSLGFSPQFTSLVSGPAAEFPAINMSTFSSLGDSGDWDYYDEASHNFSAVVDKVAGKHTLKAGFDYRHLATSGAGLNCPTGCYNFNGTNTGVDLGDLLLGLPSQRQADTASTLTDNIQYYGFFAQDNFRWTSKLSVNFGLRFEHEGGVTESNNGLITNFNTTGNTPITVPGLTPLGYVEYAGKGAPAAVGAYPAIKLGPRGGVAYTLNSKTVLRGGYGVFYAPQIALGGPLATPGYANNTSYSGNYTSDVLTNPFPSGLSAPVGNTLGTATGIGNGFSLVTPSAKSPTIQQYSVDVQREIGFGVALEVGYVGSHSTNLALGEPQININALPTADLPAAAAQIKNNTLVSNPFYGVISTGTLSQKTINPFLLSLPYTAFSNIDETWGPTNHASYNSMVVKAQKRFSSGLTFLSVLTFSKNMDESSAGPGNSLNGGAQGAPQNPYNMAAEYSASNVDTPLRWSSSFSYELPVGKGRRFAGNTNKALDYVIGGWVINAVTVYQTGFPLQIYQTDLNAPFGYEAQRPNMTSVAPGTSGSVEQRINEYINPAAFTLAAQGTLGNTPRTLASLRGPGQKNWDASIFKNFLITERVKAQFRAEGLNAFNTPLFASPNTNLSSGTFGQINTQSNFSRQMQLAIRVTF